MFVNSSGCPECDQRASSFGLPQCRKRVYLVMRRLDTAADGTVLKNCWSFVELFSQCHSRATMGDISVWAQENAEQKGVQLTIATASKEPYQLVTN